MAPEVTLYSVKVREKSGTVYPDGYPTHTEYNFTPLCNGMRWCIDNGIQVINFSLGIWTVTSDGQREYPLHDHEFYNLINEAYRNGIVIVAAAGNDSRSVGIYDIPDTNQDVVFSDKRYDFPASYPEVIAVSATAMKTTGKPSERGDSPASFTNYGPAIWVSAPGVSIYTTTIGGGYGTGDGTSYAAPHVVGSVALLLANKTPATDVRDTLMSTAEDLGALYWDEYYGWGLVDPGYAVTGNRAPARPHIVSPTNKLPVTWGELKGE